MGTKRERGQRGGGGNVIPGLGADLPDLQRARALWQANRFEESIALFEATANRYPQNLVALVDGSRALGARFEIGRAEVFLDRLRELARKRPGILHLAGQSYRMIFRPEKAMECFRAAVQAGGEIPDTYLELAILSERRHRLEEAESLISECRRLAPDYLEARLFHARLWRRTGREAEAESLLRDLAGSDSAHPFLRSQAWAEVAQMLDRRGEYHAAMEAMLRAKSLLLPRAGPILRESELVLGHLGRLAASLTAGHFRRWAESQPEPAERVAVLTSFPRSGTTLLEQMLDAHSDLVSSDEREAFARDIFPALWLGPSTPAPTAEALDAVPAERLARLRRRYLEYMAAALNEPIAGRLHLDKNPPMTLVLPGFLRLFPEAKLLIALRDPRDVVLSCFMQHLPLNPNSVCFLTLEHAARRYAHDLAVWREFRKIVASPWLEVRYENVVDHQEAEARRALAFLGLPWEKGVLEYRARLGAKAVGSPTYHDVAQPVYRRAVGRWEHYREFLEPILPILEPSLRAFGYAV